MDVKSVIQSMTKMITMTEFDGDLFESKLKNVMEMFQWGGILNSSKMQILRFAYIKKMKDLLFHLKDTDDLMLSVKQCVIVSKCVDCVVLIGVIPCLITSVFKSFDNQRRNVFPHSDDISTNTKYEELKFIIDFFLDLIKVPILQRVIMPKNTNILLAGLCQLSLLPIALPNTEVALNNSMDELKYEQLIKEQGSYKNILNELIVKNRDPLIIREIMFALGQKGCQKHLKQGLEDIFSELLLQPYGIQTFLRVACDLNIETDRQFRQHGHQEWSNLIHSFFKKSERTYKNCIAPQVRELLTADSKFHKNQFQSIAVYCMYLMSVEDYQNYLKYYIDPIDWSIVSNDAEKNLKISQTIEDVHAIFYLFKDETWALDPKLLTLSSMAIYSMYISTASSVYYLKSKLEDLVYLILVHFSNNKDHMKRILFSRYEIDVQFVPGSTDISIKYCERENQLNLENDVDIVLNLIDKRNNVRLMKTMFITMLDMYVEMSSVEYSVMEKFFVVKSIQHLIEKDDVKKSLSSDPEMILNLVQSILKDISEKNDENDTDTLDILSVVLMILKYVLENLNGKYFDQLDCLMNYMEIIFETVKDENVYRELILEMKQKIMQVKNTNFKKKSATDERTFDDILFDARDPLVPIRAHALIELKKLIDAKDEFILKNKETVLIVVQENIKHCDSYLYMSAIYTLSALCAHSPNEVLPVLCYEFVKPIRYTCSAETRLKLGEVLMKTVRLLNETVPMHKNLLLNTLLNGTRDCDTFVRMSSLSNLGEVCRLLHYSLGSDVNEIFSCVDYIMRNDIEDKCRRAAMFLLRQVLEGVDFDSIATMGHSILLVYKLVTFHYRSNKDEVIRSHAQLALESVNNILLERWLNHRVNVPEVQEPLFFD